MGKSFNKKARLYDKGKEGHWVKINSLSSQKRDLDLHMSREFTIRLPTVNVRRKKNKQDTSVKKLSGTLDKTMS